MRDPRPSKARTAATGPGRARLARRALVGDRGGQTGAYSHDPHGQGTATAVNGSGGIGSQVHGYAGGFDDPERLGRSRVGPVPP